MIRRTIIILLTAAAVGMIPLEIASRFRSFEMYWESDNDLTLDCWSLLIHLDRGHITLLHSEYQSSPGKRFFMHGIGYENWCRFEVLSMDKRGFRHWNVRFPIWAVFILFAAHPTVAFIRGPLRRRRRRRKGWCMTCGYDLTGNTTGICPECGTSAHLVDP